MTCLFGGAAIPDPPPWRDPRRRKKHNRLAFDWTEHLQEAWVVESAVVLRRPILVCGPPGCGKSTLAHAIASDLGLGPVLEWRVTSRTSAKSGLYRYDAIARLHDANIGRDEQRQDIKRGDIGSYIRLGPLGTALALSTRSRPRVLLIDEFDKGDIELSSNLLHVLEEGSFGIDELRRHRASEQEVVVGTEDGGDYEVRNGMVGNTEELPIIVITSNGEREFSAAFRRRVVQLDMKLPAGERLKKIVNRHLGGPDSSEVREQLVKSFEGDIENGASIAVDQLLNAIYMLSKPVDGRVSRRNALKSALMKVLDD